MELQQRLYNKKLSFAKKGILWGVIGGILYGFVPFFQTFAMEAEPLSSGAVLGLMAVPFVVGCLQDFISGIWVLIPNIKNGKHREYIRVIKSKPGKWIVIASMAGGLIASAGFMAGVYLAGPVYPVAVSATYPAVGAILSRIFLKEKISKRGWIGITLCIAGAILISFVAPSGESYPHFYLGILCAVIAALGWGLEGIISLAGMDFVDPEVALGIRQFSSAVLFFIALFFVAGLGTKAFALMVATIPTVGLVYITLAAFGAGIGYFYYYKANNACGASRGMCLNITYTFVSALLSVIFLRSPIGVNFIVGIVVLLSGAILVVGKPSELFSLRDV